MSINFLQIQDALGALLAADESIKAIIGDNPDRIQAATEANIDLPYITFGEDESKYIVSECTHLVDIFTPINVWTSENGFRQNKQIASAIIGLLHEQTIEISPSLQVDFMFERYRFDEDMAPGIKQGILEFRASVEQGI